MHISDKLKLEFQKAKKTFLDSEKICIISHRGPDGDAVGSNIGLRLALENLGKKVVSACVDPVPCNSIWLQKADTYVQDFNYVDFDVIVTVDCGDLKLVKFHETKPEILNGPKPFINFDHHFSNDGFGTINPVDAETCSTAMIIYKFLKYCGFKITVDVATALTHGIYFDTGSLMHSNTTTEVFEACADLMAKGADVKRISKELFHMTPINRLRLWGRIMERAYVNDEGVTVSAVDHHDYESLGASSKDTGGAIDYLNAVPGSKYCVLLAEDAHGRIKGSLRTQRDDVNLSDIAGKWGGGGHPKASGFGFKGRLKPTMSWKVIPENGDSAQIEEINF